MKTRKAIIYLITVLMTALMLSGCGNAGNNETAEAHKTGSMQLDYATQFSVDYYDDGVSFIKIGDGLEYWLVPSGSDMPSWLDDGMLEGRTVIKSPSSEVYMAASSGMDLINAIDGLDAVKMTSTKASDWDITEIKEKVESDKIHYVGKYSAPDFEALVTEGIDLAVESTMIYHSPQIKEQIEELGIPVLVERSSYENDPLGRLEWIKLYGLLLGRGSEAEAFFDNAKSLVEGVDTDSLSKKPSVAFFSVNSNGSVVVRKPGDYVTRMIDMAGGAYALDSIEVGEEDDNALSTMNIQMEAFYEMAVDSDIIIYNSPIESDLNSVDDLIDLSPQFKDFKAVKSGNVWCTNKSMFQKTTGVAGMIVEMNRIFAGSEDDEGMEYFHKLK
jgi:iron complex transport system substrate-binding protein